MGSTIVAYGEALWDLLPTGPVLGGAPLNFAYRVFSLGHHSTIVSRVGRDELGRKARDQIVTLGMNDSGLQWDETYPTGTVEIHLDDNKDPDYNIIENVAYDHIEFNSGLKNSIKCADCLCFGTLAQRNSVSRQTLLSLLSNFSGKFILLDINLRKNCYSDESIRSSLKQSSILKINDEELAVLVEMFGWPGESIVDQAVQLLERTEQEYCVVTLGDRGALVISKDGEKIYVPGYRVNLVDPCGSGDAFAAGFIHSLLDGQSLNAASRLGNALGAMVAGQEGATQKISHDEVLAFMAANQPGIIDETLTDFIE